MAHPAQSLPNLKRETAPWLFAESTQAVFEALAARGFKARAVGGSVRNALIGKAVSDIDIATDGLPEAVMAACEAKSLKVAPTGLKHGTVTVVSGAVPFEVTTLRRDVETDGRHAVVAFTDDWHADAARRDFTINALYADQDGTIFDPLGEGARDLAQRRVRFIGDADARIREDYLRILRFFRFSAEYASGDFDRDGLAAIARNVDGLDRLSVERIWSEAKKIMLAPRAVDAVDAMIGTGILVRIFGAVPQPRVFARRLALDDAMQRASARDPMSRLGALLVLTDGDSLRLAERLKLSWDEHDGLRALIATPPIAKDLALRDARKALHRLRSDYRMRLLHDWALSGDHVDDPAWRALYGVPETHPVPPFPLSGKDLLAAGLKPGPDVGAMLRALEDWWIDADYPDRAAVLAEFKRRTATP
ncbi:MAG: hypothetical protein RL291_1310 [Pseudomonadota bacterium]